MSKLELPNYYVEPGDHILIEAVDLQSQIGTFGDQKIQVDGSVDLGKFGRIRVAGLSVEEIEQGIENQIAMLGEHEAINVQLVESNAAEVYVIGEVGSPAAYPIDGHEHVLDAILRAGGLSSKASPCDIILVRPTDPSGCRVVLPVCYRQITQIGDVTTNYQLQPGDRIVVGSRTFWEEIAFWKQTKDCERCDQSCCVECQPTNVQYQNSFATRLAAFRLPSKRQEPTAEQRNGQPPQPKPEANNRVPGSYYIPADSGNGVDRPSDNDLFLPPLNSDGTPRSGTGTRSPVVPR